MIQNLKTNPWLILMRPANIITAWANILLGFAISGAIVSFPSIVSLDFQIDTPLNLFFLLLSTTGLYGGGVVMNDFFDAKLDAIERPERPIPSGKISLKQACVFGIALYLAGVMSAFCVNYVAGLIAFLIVLLTLSYNAVAKKHAFFGPLNMGLCRASNLALGMSVVSASLLLHPFWLAIPLIYIFAITYISRGEVHGASRENLFIGLGIYIFIFLVVSIAALQSDKKFGVYIFISQIPFLILFFNTVMKPLFSAISAEGKPDAIRFAVKSAVIGVIILDAAIAVVFLGIFYALIILCLLPFSRFLAKKFAVT